MSSENVEPDSEQSGAMSSENVEPDSEQSGAPAFEAECEISGRVIGTVIKDGVAKIAEGRLTLSKGDGEVIVEAPVSEVRADKARFSFGAAVQVWIGADSYALTPKRFHRASTPVGGDALNLTRDIKRLRKGKELTQLFLATVESEGGQLGSAVT